MRTETTKLNTLPFSLEPDKYDVTYGVVFCVLMAGALILQTICIQVGVVLYLVDKIEGV